MTVSSSTNKVSFNGDGSTTVFAYSFKVFDESDLTVILRASDGTETTQTITTNYTVSGVGDAGGGNVTMVTAPASGEQLTILREQPLTQGLDLVPNDPFPANSIEDSLDKLTFMVQQQQEELDRSIKASKTTTISTVEFVESAATRANKVFAFDGSGDLDLTQEIGTFQGDWAASTAYAVRDIVKDTNNNNIYIANTAHTSSGTVPLSSNADIAKWDLLVDAAAATTSANNAATSATAAATSATAAATSATAAATSESNAATSASNASTSETNAAASATNAATSESNAAGSESAAATSESNAATSATNASTSASAAATSATNAATSEAAAAASQAAAATSETNAATSATSAATNATNAATSASNASTAQTAAETAQTAAEAAQAAAELAADNFDDTYLGSKSSDPTVDNDGGALNAGDLYFNTTSNTLKVYSGSAWQDAAVDSSGFVQTTGDTMTGDLDIQGTLTSDGLTVDDKTGAPSWAGNGEDTTADLKIGDRTDHINSGSFALSLPSVNTNFESAFVIDGSYSGNLTTTNLRSRGVKYNSYYGDMSFFTTASTTEYKRLNIASNGDISFYEDTGTTPKFFWDASAESLGIGTSSPAAKIEAVGATALQLRNAATDGFKFVQQNTNSWAFDALTSGSKFSIVNSNVGIGTSSPAYRLDVQGANAGTDCILRVKTTATQSYSDAYLYLETAGSGKTGIHFGDAADDNVGLLTYDHSDDSMYIRTNAIERMRIDSSGNVGIGTSSPVAKLQVKTQTNGNAAFQNSTSVSGGVKINAFNDAANASVPFEIDGSSLQFNIASTERMRIDGSGVLLVGKSADNLTDAGQVFSTAGSSFTRSGGAACQFNRNTSDGEVIRLSKDGTTVGSIRTVGADIAIESSNNQTGLRFRSVAITPEKNASAANGTVDLGESNAKFKDLYLSGGVYLGGTGAANKLDDYEEGTFTPSLGFRTSTTGSLTYQLNSFIYIKIGSMVFISGFLTWTANNFTASSGALQLQNLPFAASGDQNRRGGLPVTYSETNFTGVTMYQQAFRTEANETNMVFNFADTANGAMDSNISSHTNISSAGGIMITGTYSTI